MLEGNEGCTYLRCFPQLCGLEYLPAFGHASDLVDELVFLGPDGEVDVGWDLMVGLARHGLDIHLDCCDCGESRVRLVKEGDHIV